MSEPDKPTERCPTDEEFSLMLYLRDKAITYTQQHQGAKPHPLGVVRGMLADFAGHMILEDRRRPRPAAREIEFVQRIAIRLSEMGFAFRADHSTMQVSIDPVEEATLSSAGVRELRTEVERTKGFDAVLMETVKLQAIVEAGDKENEVLCNRVQELREALNLALGKLEVADASPMYGSEVDEGIRDAKKIIEAALARVKQAKDA